MPQVAARVLELLVQDAKHILMLSPLCHFAVNFAAADLHRTNIFEEVSALVESSGIRFTSLVIEATERSLVEVERASESMQRLRAAGIKVAIDDFGTGYSSLAYLAQLEVDFLKIDKLFVQSLGTDSATSHVALRIIDMANDLSLSIVAEGVETKEQEQSLKELGVGHAQGYLYGRPMVLDDLLDDLRRQRAAAKCRGQSQL
ncbi:EAL domain-containing protein [Sphingomonas piscis]|uniref:EAL domain-containing protein n=1 Tax=Sphingomonas piscis TaxID=2714943 RepID=UPI0024839FDD|nr:EAL domain-containing protein [Sphingomonas piscis]